MPKGRKRGIENSSSITNFVVQDMGEASQTEEVSEGNSEELTLKSLKDVLLTELSKVLRELKDFRQDFDARLTQTENKITEFEKVTSQVQQKVQEVQQEVKQAVTETGKIQVKVQTLRDDVDQLEDYFDDLQQTLENIDNNLRRNNI